MQGCYENIQVIALPALHKSPIQGFECLSLAGFEADVHCGRRTRRGIKGIILSQLGLQLPPDAFGQGSRNRVRLLPSCNADNNHHDPAQSEPQAAEL